jgi:hypothetical protein
MDGMYKRFQDHSGKTSSTTHEYSGKYQKLVPAEPVIKPVKNQFIASGFFQSVFLEVSFKF